MRSTFFLFFLCLQVLHAQPLPFSSFSIKSDYYAVAKAKIDTGHLYTVESSKAFSGVIIKVADTSFANSYVILSKDTIFLKHDSHNDWEGFKSSQLITSPPRSKSFSLYTDKASGLLEIHFLTPVSRRDLKKKENNYRQEAFCAEPASVSQSEWREGLPDPIGTPIATPVQHIIVHHSAGSNLAQDYEEEVRNIYVLHTQGNGYDDIGYNYLIAPDGTIFKGRDGRGIVAQDNVRGAHMCNKNDSTMAICLLGNFVDTAPKPEALQALATLAGWKSSKDDLDAFGSSYHSIGPTTAQAPPAFLANIAGHRDGCTPLYTECPGEQLYQLLPELRNNIAQIKSQCIATSLEENNEKEMRIRVNDQILKIPHREYATVKLINVEGKQVFGSSFVDQIQVSPGFYLLRCEGLKSYSLKVTVE